MRRIKTNMNKRSHSWEPGNPHADLESDSVDSTQNIVNVQEPIVIIDRKRTVYGSFIGLIVLGCVILGGTFLLFGGRGGGNINRLMLFLLGTFLSGLCFVALIWIRARWICVAVVDENGIIASTLQQKYDLNWSEMIGARTQSKLAKNANVPTVQLLLLLDEERGLEMPVDFVQINNLYAILETATFHPTSPGQRLGTTKGSALFLFGTIAMLLGIWWVFVLIGQNNRGVLFQGNARAILIKLAAGIVGPLGGLGCTCWGLYHVVMRPILYLPGWIAKNH